MGDSVHAFSPVSEEEPRRRRGSFGERSKGLVNPLAAGSRKRSKSLPRELRHTAVVPEEDEEGIQCSQCGTVFSDAITLELHSRTMHKIDKISEE